METLPHPSPRPPLDHGARQVLEAKPFQIDVHERNARWTCTNCRRTFPLGDSWAVEVEVRDHTLRFVVCPQCASSFSLPPAMVVDLVRLRNGGATSIALRGFIDRVEDIALARGAGHADRITVRATDLRAFAAEHGIAAPALARLLEIEGLATSI